MRAERWRQVKDVVARAMEARLDERSAVLDEACAGDDALRQEAESLLAAAEGTGSLPAARAAVAAAADRALGTRMAGAADRPHGAGGEGSDALQQSILETALAHQYDILRPLGRGGMGAVYLARERALDRFVAIKVLRSELAAAAESRERFRREARIAAQLAHPGILPLHTFGEVGGLWYFVMGYVRGESLAERLRLEGRLTCAEAQRILAELADALECAHRHGVVHRDIKPANILLDDESGRTVLADFGISKLEGVADTLTATGAVIGTPHYMSPEQALGSHDVDGRSDIYSLGAVGYRMLAGREPFGGASAEELMYRRLSHDPTPLQMVAPSVPDDLAAVVMRCLARDRALRWPDARSLKDALGRVGCEPTPALPEALRDLPGFGPYALVWAVAWTALAVLALRASADRALLLLIALLVPAGLALHVWNVGRQGLGRLELARVAFWPPEWWGMWWPRALRRPSDLWARLPWPARLVRGALSTLFVALPGTILVRHQLVAGGGLSAGDPVHFWFGVAQGGLVIGAAVVVGGALRWALRRGLSFAEAVRTLFGATMPAPAWRTPRVAWLLATAAGAVRPPERDAPADYPRAIGELVPLLPPAAAEVGAQGVRAAHRLLAAIVRLDREAATLARDGSAAELDRLAAQVATLEAATQAESDEHRELRALVRHQLELVRRMRARCELASQQRARLFDLMRGLWTQLCALRDTPPAEPGPVAQSGDRVRALCAEIAAAVDAPPPSVRLPEGAPTAAPVPAARRTTAPRL